MKKSNIIGLILMLFLINQKLIAQSPTVYFTAPVLNNSPELVDASISFTALPSNGWTKNSTLSLTLKVENLSTRTPTWDLVYTNSTPTLNTGTISNLAPGHYKFEGNVSTKGNDLIWYTIKIYQEVWVGYNAQWDAMDEMSVGTSLNSVKRLSNGSGNAYSYIQSINEIVPSTYSWLELNKTYATTGNDSRIYCVLSPLTNPSLFVPGGNDTYIEFITTIVLGVERSSINLRYFNGTSYVNVLLSNNPNDKIRFIKQSTNVCYIQLNSSSTNLSIPNFSLSTSGPITILGKQLGDEAMNINFSFGSKPVIYKYSSYAKLTREIDAGYAQAVGGYIKFCFDEEYKQPVGKFIPFKIYMLNQINLTNNFIAGVDYNGVLSGNATNNMKMLYQFDDNRYALPITSVVNLTVGKYYLLEVETSTKEKRYLKFLYTN